MPNRFHPAPTLPGRKFQNDTARLWPDDMKIAPLGFGLPYLFGDGSDGDTTISIDTNYATGTMKQFRNLTINAGVTVSGTSALTVIIFYVSERLNLQGAINLNGLGAAGVAGAGVTYSTSYAGAGGGGGGGTAGAGSNGGYSVASGGAGGAAAVAGGNGSAISLFQKATFRLCQDLKDNLPFSWGCSGGGGGIGATAPYSLSGAGAGAILIFANEMLIGSAGSITCNGANGENGTTQGAGDHSGGAGGGAGGLIYLCNRRFTNLGSSNLTVTGGSGGAAGGAGAAAGGAGGAGTYILEAIP